MNKKVLILDDDMDILQICSIVLKKKGFDVSTLNNSNQVVERVRSYQPDVILMDNCHIHKSETILEMIHEQYVSCSSTFTQYC